MNIDTTQLKGFAEGEHLKLRPVQEADLPALAALLAEDPLPHRQQPWTLERLRKMFEDEKSPGLWSESLRFFVAVASDGSVVGYLEENPQAWLSALLVYLHVEDALPGRDLLGAELLRLFVEYKQRWFSESLLLVDIVEPDTSKAAWLVAAGFRHELRMERSALYLGEAVGRDTYALYSAERLAGEDLSCGEPAYPAAGSSRRQSGEV